MKVSFTSKVSKSKWKKGGREGETYHIVVPRAIAEALDLKVGMKVKVTIEVA